VRGNKSVNQQRKIPT